jgi:predicted RNA-binding Zn-ribbon protein involved in translation (DUF1610 family)
MLLQNCSNYGARIMAPTMPPQSKIDIAAIRASMDVKCPACGYMIAPSEMVRLDFEKMRCPSCCAEFVPKKN